MTDYINGQAAHTLNYTGKTTSDTEYVHRILHSIGVSERVGGCDAYRDGIEVLLQLPARVIARTNREYGWATIALTGNEAEDVVAYLKDSDFSPRLWSFSFAARSLHGPRRRMGDSIARIRLDRPGLELLLLAHHLMHQASPRAMDHMTDPVLRQVAVMQAQALLAADRPSALLLLAVDIFRGTRNEKLQQLDWLLEGQEPALIVCRHCFRPIDEDDPFLLVDTEYEGEQYHREHNAMPRYSAHFACYTAHADPKPGEYDHYWSQYDADARWVKLQKYRLAWAIEEQRPTGIHHCLMAAEAVALTGRAQSARWLAVTTKKAHRTENNNDLVLSLAVGQETFGRPTVRLEIRPDKDFAVVSFSMLDTYLGFGTGITETTIPTAVLWRSIMVQTTTEVYGWATSHNFEDPDSFFDTAKVILTFVVTGDDVVISFEWRSLLIRREATTMPIATLRAALGQCD